jgi:hypothetical protein
MSTVQEEARERAAQELARRVAPIAAIQDPLKWARDFIQEMTTPNPRGRWCYVHTTPGITQATPNPDAYERGGDLARDLLKIRKDDQ